MRMGLREANQNFSKAMASVKAGKEVVLTERGKPIAVIKPLEAKETTQAVIRRMESDGILRRALVPGPMTEFQPIRSKGKRVSETLREEREKN